MLLIFPPVAKPCEPPAGVALLSSALKENRRSCHVYDANVEGLLYLINSDIDPIDSWSKRALKNREKILCDLKDKSLYENMDRYHQRVYDLNKLLSISVDTKRFRITLSDYSDSRLSSVNSKDLLKSAGQYKENPFYRFFEDRVRPQILNSDSKHIGISLCYLNQALVSFALAGWIKDSFKDKKIIMGGGLISSWMSRPDYNDPFKDLVDVMIRGEGEQPLLKLSGVKDISKKHYVPDYDFVKDDLYIAPGKVLPFRASIGCYWSKCRFCPEKAEIRPYSSQRASKVLQDLKAVDQKYAPDYIHLIDNAVTPAFLKALAKNKFGFKWYGFVRFEKEFLDPGFCHDLKRSGCDMLKLGLESGDQGVLDQMNKGTNLNYVSTILKNLHQAGILTFVYLLFGTSFEDEKAAFKTLEYIKAHEKYINYLNLAVFNLPKFSDDAKDLDTREFYHGDLSLYLNFTHPFGWDRRQVKQFLDKTFKKQVSAGSGIRKNPAFFSSNHAVFFKPQGK
ncbi:radical SAM protein [Desulfobacula sp.]|uniref:B12-binding domain-containing radical SAM protein n=1 Tax=Desulfobacula sp. TaxID=2593537 RepID=UPI0025B99D43|nr:radical SAM protein [Desulfobacula sp.]MBC2705874.1 radical SAM protein [Desulfobacula sp.]